MGQVSWECLGEREEHFLIEMGAGEVFYSPLNAMALVVTKGQASEIREHFENESRESFSDRGLAVEIDRLGGFRTSSVMEEDLEDSDWSPTNLTISTTQKCTLRCSYCYADGGRREDLDIDPAMVQDGIELVLKNALAKSTSPSLWFIGEGEATANWELFCNAIRQFNKRSEELGLVGTVSLSTNGVMNTKQADFVAGNIDFINLSLDGLASVNDAQRVMPNGQGSFAKIEEFMGVLKKHGRTFSVRSTISRASHAQVNEFVEYMGSNYSCSMIHFEPVSVAHEFLKSSKQDLEAEDADVFITAFRSARQVAAKYGMEIFYSGAKTGISDSFCSATSAEVFMLTTEGHITSCNEVLYDDDERSDLFHYGKWRKGEGFDVSKEAIAKLSTLKGKNIKKCETCFAKFTCAGDCYAKSAAQFGQPWDTPYTARCDINRRLLKDEILLKIVKAHAEV